MHGFRYISLIVVGSLIYTIAVMLIQLPSYFEENFEPDKLLWFNWDLEQILTNSTVYFFAYTCQLQLLPVYHELQRRSHRRIIKVVNRAVLIQAATFFIMVLSGYFSTFQETKKIVLERKSLAGNFIDPTILMAIVSTVALMIIHAPVCYFPFRLAFF